MANSNTVFTFDGLIGNVGKTTVQCITDAAAAVTLRTFLETHIDGKVNSISFSDRYIYSGVPGAGSNTDHVAVVYFQDTATGNTLRISIPSIKDTDTEEVAGREGGIRTTDTFNLLLIAALQTATGKTFRPLYGVVYGKK